MIATYRLQLHPGFGFDAARRIVPYLRRLGISHLYLSPVTDARRGSVHGYDVVDHTRLREELGGPEAFERLADAVHGQGLRLIVDFVPNHGGVGARNARWQDVLAHGERSRFARFFDIDWDPPRRELRGKVLLPYLGRPYGEALDAGEITLVEEDGRPAAAYYHNRFALDPRSWPQARALLARSPGGAIPAGALHRILEEQHWRLAYWKTAASDINYRRFFDVNELVALRVEDPEVFDATHTLLAGLLRDGRLDGVRIDHIDGLRDPHGYLTAVRRLGAERIWVEKILAPDESLPEAWPVEGTTGYDFLNDVLALLTRPQAARPLERLYRRLVPEALPWSEERHTAKREIATREMAGELSGLSARLLRLAEADYHTRDVTIESLRAALTEVVAALPRYRTYLPHERDAALPLLEAVVDEAQRQRPGNDPTSYDLIRRVLGGAVREDLRGGAAEWTARFQQYTAPVAAKGVEDTAFYRHVRFVALNEVGGDPDRVGLRVERFHDRARRRSARHPRTLLATATHDHKRGEDTRMRLLALAELADEWRRTAGALDRLFRGHGGSGLPAAADRYLLAQTLTALWDERDPALPDRLVACAQKAAREAKRRTSYLAPDESYEADLERFVRAVVGDPKVGDALRPLASRLARWGFVNGITQLVLKATCPGVPDFYQGTELLDLSLVDPDNRREVDFDRRSRLLEELEPLLEYPQPDAVAAMAEAADERLKLYVTARLLRCRAAEPALFEGRYLPLRARGAAAAHVVAYARQGAEGAILVVVPRFPATLHRRGGWQDTIVVVPQSIYTVGPTPAGAAGPTAAGAAGPTAAGAIEPTAAGAIEPTAAGATESTPTSPATWEDLLTGGRLSVDGAVALSACALPWFVARAPRVPRGGSPASPAAG